MEAATLMRVMVDQVERSRRLAAIEGQVVSVAIRVWVVLGFLARVSLGFNFRVSNY